MPVLPEDARVLPERIDAAPGGAEGGVVDQFPVLVAQADLVIAEGGEEVDARDALPGEEAAESELQHCLFESA